MDWQASESDRNESIEVHATIARQAKRIEELQQDLEREKFAQQLHQFLSDTVTINNLLAPMPHTRVLETMMQISVQVIGARAASIFLIDKETRELVFEIAIGLKAQAAEKFRVPLGQGVVGLVAASGQPMAIANVQADERLSVDIASALDSLPQSLLCVPLFYEDEIIGALELLDKIGDASFCPGDTQLLGLLANMAAVAIAQSQAYHDQQAVLKTLLHAFAEKDPERRQKLYNQARSFSTWMETRHSSNEDYELAMLVRELTTSGEYEYETCKHILQGMVTSLRARQSCYDFGLLSR